MNVKIRNDLEMNPVDKFLYPEIIKDWPKFEAWCVEKYKMWKPDKATLELWLEFQKEAKDGKSIST